MHNPFKMNQKAGYRQNPTYYFEICRNMGTEKN